MLQSNEYFSGKVKSIGFTSSSTGRASVGVMAEGEYTFGCLLYTSPSPRD